MLGKTYNIVKKQNNKIINKVSLYNIQIRIISFHTNIPNHKTRLKIQNIITKLQNNMVTHKQYYDFAKLLNKT